MGLMALDRSVAVAILALCPISVGHAQSAADFYKGKNVDLYIGYSAGGGYDVYARSLARHMGRFIPGNPTIVPKNMPGAGSLVLANWLYNVAPKDGTASPRNRIRSLARFDEGSFRRGQIQLDWQHE